MNSYFEKYVGQGFVPFSFSKIHLDKNGKKEMKFPAWKTITKENCANFKMGESLAIRTGKISGITVIDFDTPEAYKEMCAKYDFADTYTVRTKKGFHAYFKYCPLLKTDSKVLPNIDVRNDNGIIIAPPTSYSDSDYNMYRYELVHDSLLMNIPLELVHELQDDDISSLGSTSEESKREIKMGDYEKSILDNIDPKLYTSYEDWLKFIWAIANSFENGIQIADDFSKTVDGYKGIHDVEKHIEDDSTHSISFSYLMNLSKKSNLVNHQKLVNNHRDDNTKKISTAFLEENKVNVAKNAVQEAKQKLKEAKQEEKIQKRHDAEQTSNELYEAQRIRFEKTHCKILNEGFYVRDEDNIVSILSEHMIKACYKHIQVGFSQMGVPISFISRWLDCNNSIRCATKIGIYPKNCPRDTYNLWKPFAMELIDDYEPHLDAIELFKRHISILCNHDSTVSDWFIRWIAQAIQFPEIKTTMPTFVSKEGAGKNSLLELLHKLLGSKKIFETTDPARDVFGAFNSQMADSFLVILSELSPIDMKNASGKIKGLITDATISINTKGVKQYNVDSYHRFIVFTNNEEAIKPTKDDRRNVVIRCSDELCKPDKTPEQLAIINDYISKFRILLSDLNAQKTIYEYLKQIPDLDQFHTQPPPRTEFHKTQSELSMSPIEQWVREFTLFHHAKEEVKLSSGDIYNQFREWAHINASKYECTKQQFGVRLTNLKLQGLTKGEHTRSGETKIFNIPLLKTKYGIVNVEREPEETFSEV